MNTTTPSSPAHVAVVTGASRGAGKGIALVLGAAGMTVYVTGRSQHEGDAELPGTVRAAPAAGAWPRTATTRTTPRWRRCLGA